MRIAEMQQREPFVEILTETLSRGWSNQFGQTVKVLPPEQRTHDVWRMQPLLNVCYRLPLLPAARDFIRDSFRYTPVAWRMPMQWALGTVLVGSYGLSHWSLPAFHIEQAPREIDQLIIVPGNQRIRVFDFANRICRVFLKAGFDVHSMQREIELRSGNRIGPAPRITSWGEDNTWFEEPFLDVYVLPRCPPIWNRRKLEQQALSLLNEWLEATTQTTQVDAYLTELCSTLERSLLNLEMRLHFAQGQQIRTWVRVLADLSLALSSILVAETHGDFQAGNILVGKQDRRVLITDWEHSQPRYRLYDLFVYKLGTRSSAGLAQRLQACIEDKVRHRNDWLPAPLTERKAALALCLLEDLIWYIDENSSSPFTTISNGLISYCKELERLGARLQDLFKAGPR